MRRRVADRDRPASVAKSRSACAATRPRSEDKSGRCSSNASIFPAVARASVRTVSKAGAAASRSSAASFATRRSLHLLDLRIVYAIITCILRERMATIVPKVECFPAAASACIGSATALVPCLGSATAADATTITDPPSVVHQPGSSARGAEPGSAALLGAGLCGRGFSIPLRRRPM
jgi:hypothetical protein